MFYFSIWGGGYFHGVRILWGGIFMVLGAVPRFHSGDSWYRYQTPESCKQNMCSSLTISLTENYFCLFWFGTTPDSIQELLLPNITFFFFWGFWFSVARFLIVKAILSLCEYWFMHTLIHFTWILAFVYGPHLVMPQGLLPAVFGKPWGSRNWTWAPYIQSIYSSLNLYLLFSLVVISLFS